MNFEIIVQEKNKSGNRKVFIEDQNKNPSYLLVYWHSSVYKKSRRN
jgi:hypothetical protein